MRDGRVADAEAAIHQDNKMDNYSFYRDAYFMAYRSVSGQQAV